jgi:hypothetical protein
MILALKTSIAFFTAGSFTIACMASAGLRAGGVGGTACDTDWVATGAD